MGNFYPDYVIYNDNPALVLREYPTKNKDNIEGEDTLYDLFIFSNTPTVIVGVRGVDIFGENVPMVKQNKKNKNDESEVK